MTSEVLKWGQRAGWRCEPCRVSCLWFKSEVKAEKSWEQHLKSKRHTKVVTEAKP